MPNITSPHSCFNSEKKTPLGGFNSKANQASLASEAAAREAVRMLRDLGVADPVEAMRLGALAMVRRSVLMAEQRGKPARYLRAIVLNGGPWADDDSASAMLRDINLAREELVV